ncbi:MAG: helix-turn-helix transcriptional regulator [Microcoleus sp. SIO2G3]|nr:helix-turn-helix transcriptional regulator [Microcoleus sp. SIO2G3]
MRHGFSVTIRDAQLGQAIRFENPHGQCFPLISKFHLSGNSRVLTPATPNVEADYEEIAGYNYLYYLPDLTEFEEWRSAEAIRVIILSLDLAYLESFGDDLETLPDLLQQLITGNLTQRFHRSPGKITSAMAGLLQQILGCPYQGVTRRMYLESKALELFTLQCLQWNEEPPQNRPSLKLRRSDIERLHHAEAILREQMDDPPSLLELAQQVGLSDRKLKQGFRQLFGTTVFGYLHDERMNRARELLQTQSISVTEVAGSVGYASLSAFNAAFKQRFGLNPSACRSQIFSVHCPFKANN